MKIQAFLFTIIALFQVSKCDIIPSGRYHVGSLPNPFKWGTELCNKIVNKLTYITEKQSYWFQGPAEAWENWMKESMEEFSEEGLAYGEHVSLWLQSIKPHLKALFQDSEVFELYAEDAAAMSVEAIIEYLPLILLVRKLEQAPSATTKARLLQVARKLEKNKDNIKVCVRERTYYISHWICNSYRGCTVDVPRSQGCPFRLFQNNS